MANLTDTSLVRVVNKGEKPYTIMYDSISYVLQPGKDTWVPFPAVALWFGDPRSAGTLASIVDERGVRTYVPDRETEVRRLRVKYGNAFGDESVVTGYPDVELYDMDNDRVMSVLDDPTGENVMPAQSTVADQSNLMTIIQRQQAQIDQLAKLAGLNQSAESQVNPVPAAAIDATGPDGQPATDPFATENTQTGSAAGSTSSAPPEDKG